MIGTGLSHGGWKNSKICKNIDKSHIFYGKYVVLLNNIANNI
jgi:hypothetical protein